MIIRMSDFIFPERVDSRKGIASSGTCVFTVARFPFRRRVSFWYEEFDSSRFSSLLKLILFFGCVCENPENITYQKIRGFGSRLESYVTCINRDADIKIDGHPPQIVPIES